MSSTTAVAEAEGEAEADTDTEDEAEGWTEGETGAGVGAAERPTDRLRAATGETWERAARHRFVRELQSGEVDEDVYRAYLVQDHAFVSELVSLFGYALARAPTIEAKRPFAEFLETVTSDENDYFDRALDALDVDGDVQRAPPIADRTREFTDLMARAAGGSYAETLAVLVPVEWIYLDWATWADEEGRPDDWVLDEWIELHANEAFEAFVEHMRAELDRELEQATLEERQRITQLFERAVELEIDFWDQAYELAG